MKKIILCVFSVFFSYLCFAQDDKSGCSDHPLFTRMPDFYLYECGNNDFEKMTFYYKNGGSDVIGGKYTYLAYWIKSNTSAPSATQILSNYENAIKKLGGKVIYSSGTQSDMMLAKNGAETWVSISAMADSYRIKIIERKGMQQVVEANADFMKQGLIENGKVALYGILFDTGKSVLRPESSDALKEIAKLLNADKSLIVFVVGHTDNVGDYQMNLKLSSERSAAVIKELTAKYSVSTKQLISFGAGSMCPVSTNENEQGRQLNRRVELVKK
jgi:outer membrane protein OmpA-like peptidoglycan-associated protein